MGKEVTFNLHVPNCTAQLYHQAVYQDPTAVQRFHREVNKNPNAEASPWSNGSREVVFQLRVSIPAVLQKLIGSGPIIVREVSAMLPRVCAPAGNQSRRQPPGALRPVSSQLPEPVVRHSSMGWLCFVLPGVRSAASADQPPLHSAG